MPVYLDPGGDTKISLPSRILKCSLEISGFNKEKEPYPCYICSWCSDS